MSGQKVDFEELGWESFTLPEQTLTVDGITSFNVAVDWDNAGVGVCRRLMEIYEDSTNETVTNASWISSEYWFRRTRNESKLFHDIEWDPTADPTRV